MHVHTKIFNTHTINEIQIVDVASDCQLTIDISLAKRIKQKIVEYPSLFISNPISISHHVLLNNTKNNVCHAFYINSLVSNKK